MATIFSNLERDSIYGMVWRVGIGAVLSMVDAMTDIYVILKYYRSGVLESQANAMLAMIVTNLSVQILISHTQYKNMSWKRKAQELLITLLFLRPIVDAYRVSTHFVEENTTADTFAEMMINKVRRKRRKRKKSKAELCVYFSLHYYARFFETLAHSARSLLHHTKTQCNICKYSASNSARKVFLAVCYRSLSG